MGIAQLLRVLFYEFPRAVFLAPWRHKFRIRLHRVALTIPF
jgi:hypothetical protein